MCVRARLRMGFASPIEHPARNAEVFSGLSLVSTGTLKHFVDDAVLKIGQRFS